MKKKIILSTMALVFALNNTAFAATSDVVQQLMEKALFNIGSKVIDKFAPYPGSFTPRYNVPAFTPVIYTPPVVTTTAPITQAPVTQGQEVNEQLIPITR